jgi:hypothetical protein
MRFYMRQRISQYLDRTTLPRIATLACLSQFVCSYDACIGVHGFATVPFRHTYHNLHVESKKKGERVRGKGKKKVDARNILLSSSFLYFYSLPLSLGYAKKEM